MNVRKRNVRFGKPNKSSLGLKLFGSSQMSDNQTKPVSNRFGTGFVFENLTIVFGYRMCPKSELFGNGTLFRMSEIRMFRFLTFTVCIWLFKFFRSRQKDSFCSPNEPDRLIWADKGTDQ